MLADRVRAKQAAPKDIVRADPVTLEEFGYLLGQERGVSVQTKAGVTIGPKRALGITAWYSGVRWIAEQIAGLPCPTYRDNPDGRQRRSDASWKRQPGPETPWFALIEFFLMSLLHKGNAYGFKQRSMSGQVQWLIPVHPDRVKVGQASDGSKVFEIDHVPYTSREILHIPGLSYDGVVGLNPIEYNAEALGVVAAANESAGRSFGAGSGVDAWVTVPKALTMEQADTLKAQWDKHHKGLVNAHELAILSGGAEYHTIGLNPEQSQLLESRKYGVTEVARMLRLTPQRLYDLERATFSNIEHQAIMDVQDGILPWCRRLEEWIRFDRDLTAPRTFHEFNVDGLLRGDFKTRMEGYQLAVQGGFETPEGVRDRENWPRIEGSNVLFQPLNMRTVGPDAVPLPEEDPDAFAP
jgi:HK97 family phage portal protein